jgi:hypothetical protein
MQNPNDRIDFVLLFVQTSTNLENNSRLTARELLPQECFGSHGRKRTSGVKSDLNENIVRDIGLAKGMVDVKVCAVDEVWSGLKFVFRLKDRANEISHFPALRSLHRHPQPL